MCFPFIHWPIQSEKKASQASVYDSPRAMAKLLKEAKRVKQVLSANTDHFAQVGILSTPVPSIRDVDLK